MNKNQNNISWQELSEKISSIKNGQNFSKKESREDISEILRKRARVLATVESQEDDQADLLNIIEFKIGQEMYAFETKYLKEVTSSKKITELPSLPDSILGVINLRGKIVTIVDLKKYLNLNYVGINDSASVIIVDYNGISVGFVADLITGIKNIKISSVQKSKPDLQKIKEEFLYGISDESVIILNVITLLQDKSIQVNHSQF